MRIVLSITRGPAKPISAPGSASVMSPCAAKEAETPPVHGSARMLMNGSFAWRSRAIAALVFAICMSESAPSCMRAPPDDETMINGAFEASAASAASAIRSPTTTPMEPPRKEKSRIAKTIGLPASVALPARQASAVGPDFARVRFNFASYGSVPSENRSTSEGWRSSPIGWNDPASSSRSMRRFASIRMWCPQSGQTFAFSVIVFEKAIFPHASFAHFVHRPAGISFFLRKDQAIDPLH